MAQINQVAGLPIAGGDISVKNYSASVDIGTGLVVKLDTSNFAGTNLAPGVILTASDVDAFGVTLETIPFGKTGRVRVLGGAVCTASATIHAGDVVMSDSAGKVLPQTSGKVQIGRAMAEALNGDAVLVWLDKAKNA